MRRCFRSVVQPVLPEASVHCLFFPSREARGRRKLPRRLSARGCNSCVCYPYGSGKHGRVCCCRRTGAHANQVCSPEPSVCPAPNPPCPCQTLWVPRGHSHLHARTGWVKGQTTDQVGGGGLLSSKDAFQAESLSSSVPLSSLSASLSTCPPVCLS